ncbi:hypothetical protein K437DRAFT_232182 [Tilletiaria anomala UBC 951]|uniref:Uncharacterized protein n=1 Tax=Tilletiaria anomala (strain ATCC 24038 / CBS 436.72 / UBC 951) TaxID=1037660 RepID=A0A066WFI0_TILAU|nr:uncharacterized protein K437DRAFT_232182 [Tilletiaria anomala UBC 951]KDN52546.1 hypothetical protein K437DRAFT_232182 [Tilletiaria anomala UBC 951]
MASQVAPAGPSAGAANGSGSNSTNGAPVPSAANGPGAWGASANGLSAAGQPPQKGSLQAIPAQLLQVVQNIDPTQIKQMIQRIQELRAKGETATEEYKRLFGILGAVQQFQQLRSQQEHARRLQAQAHVQQQGQSAANGSSAASQPSGSAAPGASRTITTSSFAVAAASSSAPNGASVAPKADGISVANGIHSAINTPAASSPAMNGPSAAPSLQASAAFTPEQMSVLRSQMQAFRLLSRNVPLPPNIQTAILAPNKAIDDLKLQIPDLSPLGTAGKVAQAAAESHLAARVVQAVKNGDPVVNEVGPDGRKKEIDANALTKVAKPEPQHNPESKVYPYNSFVHPFTYLSKASLGPGHYIATSQQRILVPSLMPAGLDIGQLMDERNRFVKARIHQRISELESMPSTMSQKPPLKDVQASPAGASAERGIKGKLFDSAEKHANAKVKALIELKSLYLLEKQKALREQVVRSMSHASTLALDRTAFRRFKRQTLRDARMTEQLERKQRLDREKRARQKHIDYLNTICNHGRDLINAHRGAQSAAQRLGKMVLKLHVDTEREEQKRIERIAKERLNALRADDEEAYLKLIDTAKDTRIAHLLRQTDVYLDNLAQAVQAQQNDDVHAEAIANAQAGLPPPGEAGTDANQQVGVQVDESMFGATRQDDPSEDSGKVDYYSVAHRITETVTEQPSILVGGKLKVYQIKGLQWMVSLFNNRLNGILADEMGLGKTIQTISLITFLIEAKRQPAPYLVIVPLSTLTNWVNEFAKWAPSVGVIVYKGSPPVRKTLATRIRQGGWQVLLTTYEYIIKDKQLLGKIKWIHMIIDEGHRMKNAGSKLSLTLTQFYVTRYRLLLTGTPLQNSLPELWALLNFVLPKIFNSVKSFDEWFNTPFANAGGADGSMQLNEEEQLLIIKRLHKVLRPFLLRRLKRDVESELPDKVEKVIKCPKSALQAKLYHQMTKHKTFFTGEELGKSTGKKMTGIRGLQNAIMQLRKICNHPYVFEEVEAAINPEKTNGPDLYRVAGKFELLDRILPKLKATGHRVLMFFQMTAIMDIMEDYLRWKALTYLRLDGSTKPEDRSKLLEAFNAPNSEYFMFILSTRAGGLGLNLQTADTVIIFDSDWNPHQDLQAQDRAHRIGQKQEVRILRLVTEKSVEEKILEIAHRKLDMDGKVIQAGRFDNNATNEERDVLLRAMLESAEDEEDEEESELTNEELNQLIARGEAEEKRFNEMDQERERQEQADWKAAGNKGKRPERLITEAELPEHFQQSFEDAIAAYEEREEEPSVRKRTVVRYNDDLTEDQFLAAVENEQDLTEVVEKKRAAAEKRRLKKLAREEGGSSTPEPGKRGRKSKGFDEETPEGSPAPGRKRKRTADTETPEPDESHSFSRRGPAPGGKRHKGSANTDMREAVNQALVTCYRALETCIEEETTRKRCSLFLDLPNAKLYPDYRQIIAHPICMRQIKRRIDNRTYRDVASCKSDIHLMFDNARIYNQEGSWVWNDANILQKAFDDKYDEVIVGSGLPGDDGQSASAGSGASVAKAAVPPTGMQVDEQDDDDDEDQVDGRDKDGDDDGDDDDDDRDSGATATPASGSGAAMGTGGGGGKKSLKLKFSKRPAATSDDDDDER